MMRIQGFYEIRWSKKGSALVMLVLFIPLIMLLLANLARNAIFTAQAGLVSREQGQLFFLAESGLSMGRHLAERFQYTSFSAVRSLDEGNFTFDDIVGSLGSVTDIGTVRQQLEVTADLQEAYDFDEDGFWFQVSGLDGDSISGTNFEESLRFAVVELRAMDKSGVDRSVGWEILSEATLAGRTRRHRLVGTFDSLGDYAYFDAGDVDFNQVLNLTIRGPVHVNGNLTIDRRTSTQAVRLLQSASWLSKTLVTTSSSFKRLGSRSVTIQPLKPNGERGREISIPQNEGSDRDGWMDPDEGAVKKYKDALKDGQWGVKEKKTPPFETVAEGGFYDMQSQNGGLRIDDDLVSAQQLLPESERFVRKKRMFMASEGRYVDAFVLDVDRMNTSADYPDNGLVYAPGHLLVRHGDELVSDLSIVSQGNMVLAGDFNDESAQNYSAMTFSGNRVYYGGDKFGQPDPSNRDCELYDHKTYGTTQRNAVDGEGNSWSYYGDKQADRGLRFRGPKVVEYRDNPAGGFTPLRGDDGGTRSGRSQGLNYYTLMVSSQPRESWCLQRKHSDIWKQTKTKEVGPEMVFSNYIERMAYSKGPKIPAHLLGGQVYLRNAPMVDLAEGNNPEPGEQAHIVQTAWGAPDRQFTYQRDVVENAPFLPKGSITLLWQGI